VIDFFSRWLDNFDQEDIQLILGQMIYGLIRNTLFFEYGRLVQHFVDNDDSVALNAEVKLKYVDEIFAECHRNIHALERILSIYRDHEFHVTDVEYDKVARNVSFLITNERAIRYNRWQGNLPRIRGERLNDARSLLRRR
jgi:hypothetical protein